MIFLIQFDGFIVERKWHNYGGTHGKDARSNLGDKCKKCFNSPPDYYDGSV
jgi:hypothetical protein